MHPFVELNVRIMDRPLGYAFVIAGYVLFVADCIITVLTIARLNTKLHRLNELAGRMRGFSDKLTERIGEKGIEAGVHMQEGQLQAALGHAELSDEVERIRESIIRHRHYGYGRILRAFPNARHILYNEEFANTLAAMKARREEVLKARAERKAKHRL